VEELQAFGKRAQEAAASVIVMFNIADCEGVETLPLANFTPVKNSAGSAKPAPFVPRGSSCTSTLSLAISST
jgi:hypothetical protein